MDSVEQFKRCFTNSSLVELEKIIHHITGYTPQIMIRSSYFLTLLSWPLIVCLAPWPRAPQRAAPTSPRTLADGRVPGPLRRCRLAPSLAVTDVARSSSTRERLASTALLWPLPKWCLAKEFFSICSLDFFYVTCESCQSYTKCLDESWIQRGSGRSGAARALPNMTFLFSLFSHSLCIIPIWPNI
jgi:hypothetical protein